MRPLADQTILITGATDGLGRALAHDLARRGAMVLLHGRSDVRLADTRREILEACDEAAVRSYRADFSSLDAVRRLAGEIGGDHQRLDVLVNNAGIGFGPPGGSRQESVDGYDLRFAVNYLAPFLLTTLLLPLLRRSAPARIVNVASAGQQPIDFDDPMLQQHYDGVRAYRQSKLAEIMFTFELAERLRVEDAEVTVNALHPATYMNTKMVFEHGAAPLTAVEDGLEATRQLVIAPELDGKSGLYFDRLREASAQAQAYDPEARRRLWRMSEEWTDSGRGVNLS